MINKKRKIIGKRKHPTLKNTSLLTESKSAVHTLADTWKREWNITTPATPEAKQWDGYGTALKPACEMIVLARKPLSEKNIALNVLKWGTGGINIDGCRIEKQKGDRTEYGIDGIERKTGNVWGKQYGKIEFDGTKDRFPSNVILDEEAASLLDEQSGQLSTHGGGTTKTRGIPFSPVNKRRREPQRLPKGDSGGASKFFYVAKASKSERNTGLEGFEEKQRDGSRKEGNPGGDNPRNKGSKKVSNFHPTVKPIKLMRFLVRLITPPNGICVDPFLGSGTTAIACIKEGFDYIGIEKEKEYFDIAEKRIFYYKRNLKLF